MACNMSSEEEIMHPGTFGRAILALTLVVSSCGPGRPSENDGRSALRSAIDGGNEERVALVEFAKSDGRAGEVMSVPVYTLMYTAEAEFAGDAMYSIGTPLGNKGQSIVTRPYSPPSQSFSWSDFLSSSQGFRPARKGDRLHLTGELEFEKRESGWVPTGLTLEVVHDSTGRQEISAGAAPGMSNGPGALPPASPPAVEDYVGAWAGPDHCMRIKPVPDGLTVNVWYCEAQEDPNEEVHVTFGPDELQSTDKAVRVRFVTADKVPAWAKAICQKSVHECVAVWFDAGTENFQGGVFLRQGERFDWER